MLRITLLLTAALLTLGTAIAADKDGEWKTMFNGKSLEGWKASENQDSWKVADGTLVCHGPRSHLFYAAEKETFKNFEFECEVMTTPGSNAGIYFHTRYQETGWPRYGLECQVNVTQSDPKKSGSLYGVVDIPNPGLQDRKSTRLNSSH